MSKRGKVDGGTGRGLVRDAVSAAVRERAVAWAAAHTRFDTLATELHDRTLLPQQLQGAPAVFVEELARWPNVRTHACAEALRRLGRGLVAKDGLLAVSDALAQLILRFVLEPPTRPMMTPGQARALSASLSILSDVAATDKISLLRLFGQLHLREETRRDPRFLQVLLCMHSRAIYNLELGLLGMRKLFLDPTTTAPQTIAHLLSEWRTAEEQKGGRELAESYRTLHGLGNLSAAEFLARIASLGLNPGHKSEIQLQVSLGVLNRSVSFQSASETQHSLWLLQTMLAHLESLPEAQALAFVRNSLTTFIGQQPETMGEDYDASVAEFLDFLLPRLSESEVLDSLRTHIFREPSAWSSTSLGHTLEATLRMQKEFSAQLQSFLRSTLSQALQEGSEAITQQCIRIARLAANTKSHTFPPYSEWFTTVMASREPGVVQSKRALQVLEKALTGMVPLETQTTYLRVHRAHLPTLLDGQAKQLVQDYCDLVKTRIADLGEDPNTTGPSEMTSSEAEAIFMDIDKAVKDFCESSKIPKFLLELHIFKRNYYIQSFLPRLLDMSVPTRSEVEHGSEYSIARARLIEHLIQAEKVPSALVKSYRTQAKERAASKGAHAAAPSSARTAQPTTAQDASLELLITHLRDSRESLVKSARGFADDQAPPAAYTKALGEFGQALRKINLSSPSPSPSPAATFTPFAGAASGPGLESASTPILCLGLPADYHLAHFPARVAEMLLDEFGALYAHLCADVSQPSSLLWAKGFVDVCLRKDGLLLPLFQRAAIAAWHQGTALTTMQIGSLALFAVAALLTGGVFPSVRAYSSASAPAELVPFLPELLTHEQHHTLTWQLFSLRWYTSVLSFIFALTASPDALPREAGDIIGELVVRVQWLTERLQQSSRLDCDTEVLVAQALVLVQSPSALFFADVSPFLSLKKWFQWEARIDASRDSLTAAGRLVHFRRALLLKFLSADKILGGYEGNVNSLCSDLFDLVVLETMRSQVHFNGYFCLESLLLALKELMAEAEKFGGASGDSVGFVRTMLQRAVDVYRVRQEPTHLFRLNACYTIALALSPLLFVGPSRAMTGRGGASSQRPSTSQLQSQSGGPLTVALRLLQSASFLTTPGRVPNVDPCAASAGSQVLLHHLEQGGSASAIFDALRAAPLLAAGILRQQLSDQRQPSDRLAKVLETLLVSGADGIPTDKLLRAFESHDLPVVAACLVLQRAVCGGKFLEGDAFTQLRSHICEALARSTAFSAQFAGAFGRLACMWLAERVLFSDRRAEEHLFSLRGVSSSPSALVDLLGDVVELLGDEGVDLFAVDLADVAWPSPASGGAVCQGGALVDVGPQPGVGGARSLCAPLIGFVVFLSLLKRGRHAKLTRRAPVAVLYIALLRAHDNARAGGAGRGEGGLPLLADDLKALRQLMLDLRPLSATDGALPPDVRAALRHCDPELAAKFDEGARGVDAGAARTSSLPGSESVFTALARLARALRGEPESA